jgi:hypothetical protein
MLKCTIWSYSLDQVLEFPQLLSTGAGVALGLDLRHDIRTRSISKGNKRLVQVNSRPVT